jgi:hypothetical protein
MLIRTQENGTIDLLHAAILAAWMRWMSTSFGMNGLMKRGEVENRGRGINGKCN